MKKLLVVIAGPTAIGKTSITIELAKHFSSEIISCDSRQFYREMSIGTAKPTAKELQEVPHHFINSHSIKEEYTVSDYEGDAIKVIQDLHKKHDVVFMTGGSGLFIKAVTEGLNQIPEVPQSYRKDLESLLENQGIKELQNMLKVVDPVTYFKIDLHNPRRLIRALEVYQFTKQPISYFYNKKKKSRPFHTLTIVLSMERELLYNRINKRVDLMFAEGLVEEVEGLMPYKENNALKTVGYTELFSFFEGRINLDKARENIQKNSRNYAKRQQTWFLNQAHNHLLKVSENNETPKEILALVQKTLESI